MYDISSIVQAANIAEALQALDADSQARLIAGGTDILLKIRDGKLPNCHLVSIHDAAELRGISLDGAGDLHIGPLTSFRELEESAPVREKAPLLAQAAATVGGPQIRAMATLGGNICNGAVSADSAPALFCYQAELVIRSLQAERRADIRDFYTGPGRVKLEQGEMLTDIIIHKADSCGWQGEYRKYSMRQAMDISTLGLALLLQLSGDKRQVEQIRLACGVAAPTPIRLPLAEAALSGLPTEQALQQIAALIRQEISPRDSWRAGRDFRLQVAGENGQRALRHTIKAAGGVC